MNIIDSDFYNEALTVFNDFIDRSCNDPDKKKRLLVMYAVVRHSVILNGVPDMVVKSLDASASAYALEMLAEPHAADSGVN